MTNAGQSKRYFSKLLTEAHEHSSRVESINYQRLKLHCSKLQLYTDFSNIHTIHMYISCEASQQQYIFGTLLLCNNDKASLCQLISSTANRKRTLGPTHSSFNSLTLLCVTVVQQTYYFLGFGVSLFLKIQY